jgi:hypothetical protein
MTRSWRQFLLITLIAGWAVAVGVGGLRFLRYESAAGAQANAPGHWPSETRIVRKAGQPTLVMLIHPHCPCTRATIGELAKLMTDCQGKLLATVFVIRPPGVATDWEKTDLWTSAAAIPGVTVLSDEDGREAQRFGALTSGQAVLYAPDGTLLFSGGITESRGHSGDNAGRSAITSLVLQGTTTLPQAAHTPVYGCPLFKDGVCSMETTQPCQP